MEEYCDGAVLRPDWKRSRTTRDPAGLAESTIKSYLDCLRRYVQLVEERGSQTTTLRTAKG